MITLVRTAVLAVISTHSNFLKVSAEYLDKDGYLRAPGHCMIGGNCGENPDKPKSAPSYMPCVRNGTKAGPMIDPSAFRLLEENCPDIVQGRSIDEVNTCCFDDGIAKLAEGFKQAQSIFARCPSCWYNFKQNNCQATCHPDQSLFIQIKETTEPGENALEPESIAAPKNDIMFSEAMVNNWYSSCQNVFYPPIQDTVISITCNLPKDQCSPYDWLRFQGTSVLSPTTYDYVLVAQKGEQPTMDTSFTYEQFQENYEDLFVPNGVPMETEFSEGEEYSTNPTQTFSFCNESVPWAADTEEICSCQDCKLRTDCLSDLPQPEDEETISFWYVSLGLEIGFLIVAGFYVLATVKSSCLNEDVEDESTFLERVYVKMRELIGDGFQFWAENVVCKYRKFQEKLTLVRLLIFELFILFLKLPVIQKPHWLALLSG